MYCLIIMSPGLRAFVVKCEHTRILVFKSTNQQPQLKWEDNLVTTDDHFSIPQGLGEGGWMHMGSHFHFITPEVSTALKKKVLFW